ncbi:HpcH/HpaI aldolase/citrate lyase family protein [Candidatus Marimicrobium litorale]|uniref:CoA ester lyase n=1 Tax=Candidatus Marimicrobium litorale TaxID=2518991 RepID=A0ABT3T317_9GAMM|nr:CoA ester lyase [Candidatus Marimicrobium litorale]MCX2976504.1 CoA ester lyase [Candidatus Marimicrobium litorale]
MKIRPRRSLLYMPGSNARALDKARSLPADGLILDLEDAVAPDAKELAREQIGTALAEGGYGHRELIVRINGLDTEWGHDDIAAVSGFATAPDGLLVPKINFASDVTDAIAAIDGAGCSKNIGIWLMAETPHCMLNIGEIAAAHPRVVGMVMGTSDLSKDTRVRHTRDRLGFIGALNLCVYAARAHELTIIDGVQLDLEDEEMLRYSCEQGRDLGFDGKSLIHPKQIAVTNGTFAPDAAEITAARDVIAGFEEAQAQGKAVVVVKGRLVENLHVEEARRQLALAEAIEQMT